jgi:TRAP-type C4-dicarboxylate transport system substrate-binding protein
VYLPILALQMPLFKSWARLDKARAAMASDLEKGAAAAGFFLAGWFDVGLSRPFAKGFAVKLPDDLKGKKPFRNRDDANEAALAATIGVSGVPLGFPEVLPNLNAGKVNALQAPALLAEQLQWSSKLDNLTAHVVATVIGGLVFSSKRIDALSAELKNILVDTSKVAAGALTKKIRSEDDAAFARLKGKMTVTTPSADDAARWDEIFAQTRKKLAEGTFSADLVSKLEGYAAG